MSDEEDNKFFVAVKGGTEEERNSIRDKFKDIEKSENIDVDLAKVEGEPCDLSVSITSKCGEVELTKSDLTGEGDIITNALNKVRCPIDGAAPTIDGPVEIHGTITQNETPSTQSSVEAVEGSDEGVDSNLKTTTEPTTISGTTMCPTTTSEKAEDEKDGVQGDTDPEE